VHDLPQGIGLAGLATGVGLERGRTSVPLCQEGLGQPAAVVDVMRQQREPLVSVLMGVYNAADTLDRTLDSILGQEGVSFEFIVVNDGSSDGSAGILERRAAEDNRLIVVHQPNSGLTAALRRGARLARGRYIARQDAGGDVSLPGRLAAQASRLADSRSAVFVTCGCRYIDPDGVFLCEEIPDEAQIALGLSTLAVPGVRGIMHPSAMFSRQAFEAVGGYRAAFTVAQDIDLWLRLHELGACVVVKEVLYDYRYSPEGISSRRYAEQLAFADLAVRCAIARRSGRPEPDLVPQDHAASLDGTSARSRLADYHYFVARCLHKRDPRRARAHYVQAWRKQPTRWKALLGAALTW
jgi:cellulose synthase/poly-beta-1,6-N-acetylglucosamine synthase-like glycosyltransferase